MISYVLRFLRQKKRGYISFTFSWNMLIKWWSSGLLHHVEPLGAAWIWIQCSQLEEPGSTFLRKFETDLCSYTSWSQLVSDLYLVM